MPSGKHSSQELAFIQPTDEQIWICLNRLITFDEPLVRFERANDLASRYINNKNDKTKKISDYSLPDQDYLFQKIFGSAKNLASSSLLNLALAFEDLKRFTPIAFQLWHSLAIKHSKEAIFAEDANQQFAEMTNYISANNKTLTNEKKEWLNHALRAVPDWHVLLQEGIWKQDIRANFLADCLNKLDKSEIEKSFSQVLNKWRSKLPASFLPHLLVLAEGPTEEILLPLFAEKLGSNFSNPAVMIIACGGSKQLLKKYLVLKEITTLPIVSVLDHDASEVISFINDALRPNDLVYAWPSGEIEDIFPLPFLVENINKFLQSQRLVNPVTVEEIESRKSERRILVLDSLWQKRNLGRFDKTGFAQFIRDNLNQNDWIPDEAKDLIKMIHSLAKEQTESGLI